MAPDIIYYSLDKIRADLDSIVSYVKLDEFEPEFIIGLTRGGSVPATMLSHRLRGNHVVAHYYPEDQQLMNLLEYEKSNILIVDDIIDSGKVVSSIFNRITGELPGDVRVASLIYNEEQPFKPHYFGRSIKRSEQPKWYDFPWEV